MTVYSPIPAPWICRPLRAAGTLMVAISLLSLFTSSAWGLGLMVLKGANSSPEFARVIAISRCEEFAVNYKVQVAGGGQQVFLISEVFGLVEYDPVLLAADLVDIQDYAPLLDVVERTRALEARYPAVKQESPRFLKPILEVLDLRDQGMVQYQGRWMTRASYDRVIAEQRQKQKDTRAMAEAVDRTRKLEVERQEAEARAQAEAAAARVKAEQRTREEEEERRMAEQKRLETEQARQAAELAEKRRQDEQLQQKLLANWNRVGSSALGAMLKAEWDTLEGMQRSGRPILAAFPMPKAAQVMLFQQHFKGESVPLPAVFGDGPRILWMEPASTRAEESGQRGLIHVEVPPSPEAAAQGADSLHACLLAFSLPANAQGGPMGGEAGRQMTAILGDVQKDLVRQLPRAVSAALTSLPRAGALSRRMPIESQGIHGHVAVTRPLLADDGTYHLVVIMALGFDVGPETPLTSK